MKTKNYVGAGRNQVLGGAFQTEQSVDEDWKLKGSCTCAYQKAKRTRREIKVERGAPEKRRHRPSHLKESRLRPNRSGQSLRDLSCGKSIIECMFWEDVSG